MHRQLFVSEIDALLPSFPFIDIPPISFLELMHLQFLFPERCTVNFQVFFLFTKDAPSNSFFKKNNFKFIIAMEVGEEACRARCV